MSEQVEAFDAKESSNIARGLYNAVTQVLIVEFKGKDGKVTSTYQYPEFPWASWEAFREAPSKGSYFAKEIRPKFKGTKVIPV